MVLYLLIFVILHTQLRINCSCIIGLLGLALFCILYLIIISKSIEMIFFKWHWKALLWILVICLGSLLPSSDLPSNSFFSQIPYFDKIVHCGLYFVFTILLASGFTKQYQGERAKAYLVSGLIAFSIGAMIEFIQTMMHMGRSGDFYDAVANTTGIVLALILFKPIQRIVPKLL